MKILIAGGGPFCTQLIARLNRERHDVYLIQSKENQRTDTSALPAEGRCTKYYFALEDEKLDFVVSSVKPSVIIFLGSMNTDYDWKVHQKSAAKLLAGLSNLLCLAVSNGIPNFVFLSSTGVYGTKYNEKLNESFAKAPENIKNLVLSQGEDLCAGMGGITGLKTVALRLSEVYGLTEDSRSDFAQKLFGAVLDGDHDTDYELPEIEFSPIYYSDAVDAVYKAATVSRDTAGIFNVGGQDTDTRRIYSEIGRLTGIGELEPDPETRTETLILTVDCGEFAQRFGYRSLVGIEAGLERTYKAFIKNQKRGNRKEKAKKKKGERKGTLSLIAPFVENLFVFALAIALITFAAGNVYLSKIDFLIFYVLIVAVTFGGFQSTIAVVLSCTFLLWQSTGQGEAAVDFVTGLDILLKMLQYFIIGALCGYRTDRLNAKLEEKAQVLGDAESELEAIYEINDSNMRIKQVLDDRLSNYENSLAKIYTITDRLNSLQVDEVFFSAINAVSEIMNSNDVSIYIVTPYEPRMCRLVARSPKSDRTLQKSVPLLDFGELAESMDRDEIFVNRGLAANLPMMAAPVFSARTLVSVIMLWTVEFENLTVYNINNFLVLSKLISSIIEKAYMHSQSVSSVTHLQDSRILKAEAYDEILKVHVQAEKDGIAQYREFHIDTAGLSFEELTGKLRGMLRNTDYMGWSSEGDLRILLTNTNDKDSRFVYDRLIKAELAIKEADK